MAENVVCHVCREVKAKYKCPRCSAQTCSLACCKKHKAENECDGKYDVTAHVPKEKMSVSTFKREYNFLMDITSRLYHAQSNPNIRNKGTWSFRFRLLYKLARSKRNIQIYFPGNHSSNLKENTSRYDKNKDSFTWHVNFLLGNKIKLVAKRVPETAIVSDLLRNQFPQCLLDEELRPKVKAYQSNFDSLTFLLEVPFEKGRRRYWKIDPTKSLQHSLENSVLYSFPEIIVCLPSEQDQFDIQSKPSVAEFEEIGTKADELFATITQKYIDSNKHNRKKGRGNGRHGRGRRRNNRGRGVGKKRSQAPKPHPLAR